MAQSLPETMKALVCEEVGQPLKLKTLPTPQATIGSVVVQVLCVSSHKSIPVMLSGKSFFTFPTPITPGNTAIGRVAAVGQDTTALEVGQLVMLEAFIRGRDNPDVQILWGFFDGLSPESKKFMANNWSMGSYAEYVRAPLENTWALDEKRLCGSPSEGGLGYTVEDLAATAELLIPYAGLRTIGVQAGETVVIAPATGGFSSAAVAAAHAMGARVIAMSRDVETLKKLQRRFPDMRIVPNTGDALADTAALKALGPIDAYLDISPPQAAGSTHIRSCFMALRQYGRASLMGMVNADLSMSYMLGVGSNLTVRFQFMYEREDVKAMVKLIESGRLRLGEAGGYEVCGRYKLEEIEECIRVTAANSKAGQMVLVTP